MLIKAKRGDRILFCGHMSPSQAIAKYPDADLYYLVNHLADPTQVNDKGAIDCSERNFGSATWLFIEVDSDLPEFEHKPTKVIESSPGRYHVYWHVPELENKELTEVKSYFRALSAYYGTDLTKPLQMLRLPGSTNHKYESKPKVTLIEDNHRTYSLSELFNNIPVEVIKTKESRQSSSPFESYIIDVYLKNKLQAHFPFPSECHNNHLNRTAFILVTDWANLVCRDSLIDMIGDWATENSHLPVSEIETCLSKFRDESKYPARWYYENDTEPELEYKKSLAHCYKSMLKDLCTYTTEDGKSKPDSLMVSSARNWFMSALLANIGYSPRCNHYLDSTGTVVTPYKVATSLEGWILNSAIKEERRVYGQLESNQIEPVVEYFKALPQVDRNTAENTLKELLMGVMKLSHLDYIQARKWLILTAKRARWGLEQTVQNQYCLILQGKQGVGKSAFFEILGGVWHTAYNQDAESHLSRGRSLIVEFPEYDRFTNKSQSEIKALISDAVDVIRPKYGRAYLNLNRLYSFGGTTNSSEILKDPTGSRRFLIVTMPQNYREPYDVEYLRRNRDMIWASALALAPDEPTEFDIESRNAIEESKEQYEASTPQEQVLREWIEGSNDEVLPYRPGTAYSYSEVAGIIAPHGRLTPGEKSHLIDLLLKLGWTKGAGRRDGKFINWMISPGARVSKPTKLVESVL